MVLVVGFEPTLKGGFTYLSGSSALILHLFPFFEFFYSERRTHNVQNTFWNKRAQLYF